ncbi:putative damage-inducible protein DinB [Pedobacter africanus]|uniref:Damage-inducible protein DinB n=1 Tax=Pedobacter africanus TaxID=151894 RepID=A0ACC6KUQ7_9SPHI|nr:DinB family protein [Pedobacter africanus]MDR6782821.1 putative damage-inducible protein DinB [Pedobacter africanus]
MLKESLKSLFTRDLNKLKSEIEQYQDEKNIWRIDKNIANPAGNLCLHLVGNLNTFIGAELGKTGYVRDRPLEFSLKDVPRAELIRKVEATIEVVNNAIDSLSEQDLESDYPQSKVVEGGSSVAFILMHLSTHLVYHLGQINYHRRLLDI